MAFGFAPAPSSLLPRVKYNAKSRAVYRVDRFKDPNGNWQSEDVEITDNFAFLLDIDSGVQGYCDFTTSPPKIEMRPMSEALPEKPSENAKPTVDFRVKLGKAELEGYEGLRTFGTQSRGVMDALEAICVRIQGAEEYKAGKMPVVKMTDTVPQKSQYGTNYMPIFDILDWAEAPALFAEAGAPPTTVATAGGPVTGENNPLAPREASDDELPF
jgi:hypothetical protein